MSTSGGVWTALERGRTAGCEVVQIFVKNNMQWLGKPPTVEALQIWARTRQAHSFHSVFGHAGYLINLAAPASPNRDRSLESILQELQFADALDIPFLVMHPGAHLGHGESTGIQRIIEGLDLIFDATKKSKVRIALENTAGQGTCLGSQVSHLGAIIDGVKKPKRLGVCLDTAHFFAAGYDISDPAGWRSAIREVEKMVGLENILAFHLNDSKTELGSRVDRHAHIGEGKIGLDGFRHIVSDPRFREVPGCIETPKSEDLHEDIKNLGVLRSLVGKDVLPRGARNKAATPRARGTR